MGARAREQEWTHRAEAVDVCKTNKKCHKRYNGMAVEASGKAGEKSAEAETFSIEAREAEWKAEDYRLQLEASKKRLRLREAELGVVPDEDHWDGIRLQEEEQENEPKKQKKRKNKKSKKSNNAKKLDTTRHAKMSDT